MKTKGIPFWERHLEHLVLGVAGLVFLAVVALQFIGSPNAVEVAQEGVITPGEVDQRLEDSARSLADVLAPTASSPVPDLANPTPVAAKFEELKTATVSPRLQLAVSSPRLNPVPDIVAPPPGTPFVVATAPAPTELAQQQFFDTLTEASVEAFPALREVFPTQPRDVTWITVAGQFDAASVLNQFKRPGPNGEVPLPSSWFNDRVYIFDVKLEREELVSGNWTNQTIIDPLPGVYSLRPTMQEKVDASIRNGILVQLADTAIQNQIMQPEFYETMGDNWSPPVHGAAPPQDAVGAEGGADAVVLDDKQQRIADLRRQLERKQLERERLLKKIADNRCPPETAAPPDNNRPGGTRGGNAPGVGDGPGGKGLGAPTISGSDNKVDLVECAKLRKRVRGIEDVLKNIEAELNALAPDIPVEEAPMPEEEIKAAPVMADVVDIWAHDITIQPGKTYRYRLIVEVYNPLFARKPDLPDAQQSLAEQLTFKSAASEWTPPIAARSWLQVFITEATPPASGGALSTSFGQAKAEVFRFSNGRWWSDRFTVQPGDRIGEAGAGGKPDFGTDWFLLDVIENIDASKDLQTRNHAASVVLQHLTESDMSQIRHPRIDARSSELRRLREEVTLDSLGDQRASTN